MELVAALPDITGDRKTELPAGEKHATMIARINSNRGHIQDAGLHMRPIEVQSYAGYKADESPRRFRLRERWVEIQAIVDRWYRGSRDPECPIADYFKVTDPAGRMYLLRHDREADEWYLVGNA